MNANEAMALVRDQYALHPAMTAQDVVKLLFQANLGCGHLVHDESAALARILDEEDGLTPDAERPLWEMLGRDWLRLDLRSAMGRGVRPEWIARMMVLSASSPLPSTREDVVRLADALPEDVCGIDMQAIRQSARRLTAEPDWLPGHSAAYRASEHPAYRVISAAYRLTLPVLAKLSDQWDKPRLLVAIDGPSGSGKSTLAAHLAEVLDAPIVHMDDFFLPHAQKTPERLSQPGGNADIERFRDEFLRPWQEQGHGAYRPYSCHEDRMLDPVMVPDAKVTLIEGSYALHPALGQPYDLRVFLTVDPQTQRERILARNGESMLRRFTETWIPLETVYHKAFGLPDAGCLVLDASHD